MARRWELFLRRHILPTRQFRRQLRVRVHLALGLPLRPGWGRPTRRKLKPLPAVAVHNWPKSFPKGCARSTRKTPISSWIYCPAHVTGRDCRPPSASGRLNSKRVIPTKRLPWACCMGRQGAENRLLLRPESCPTWHATYCRSIWKPRRIARSRVFWRL